MTVVADPSATAGFQRRPPACPGWLAAVAQRRHTRAAVGVVAHHRPLPRRTIDPRVAVVVITHNRVDEVVENLGRLARLLERPHVIVVDNGSTDGTPDAIRRQHPWVETIVADHNAGAIGRNLAVGRLSQPYVAFADDDTWWDPGSLRRAADLLDLHPDVAVLTARIVVEPAGVEDPIVADMRDSPLLDTADTWLRRPLARGLWRSMALLRRVPHDRVTATAVAEALAGLPWVLRERHVLPPVVEQQFRLLDRHQLNSPARRYVS